MDPMELGKRVKSLRVKAKLGLRELSRKAEIAPASLLAIEKGLSSPTLGTLHKVLKALDTDFPTFFAVPLQTNGTPVFRAADMKVVEDQHRKYVFCLPKGNDVRFELLRETLSPTEKDPVWEKSDCDFGGLILEGGPVKLEIEGVGEWTLHQDDSYYVKAGQKHRATNLGETPMKMITIWQPPGY